jgi:hypothetical protein
MAPGFASFLISTTTRRIKLIRPITGSLQTGEIP